MSDVLLVLNGGVLTTIQDAGRRETRHLGVPLSGAMDAWALEVANRLVGNDPGAAALEITAGGAAFEILAPTLCAVTGGNLGALIDDQRLPLWTAVFVRPGSCLRFTGRTGDWGARAYLAVAGGFDVPPVLGSRSTYLAGSFGGYAGRALRAADRLAALPPRIEPLRLAGTRWPTHARPAYAAAPTLRCVPGPHLHLFDPDALNAFLTQPFTVDARANRMGYRLARPRLGLIAGRDLPSLGVVPGVIQVPPDGTPILLMADAQTTGGYPIIGVVIAPDLSLAAQLLPGDHLRFRAVSLAEARGAHRTLQQWRRSAPQADAPELALLDWTGAL